MNLTTEKGLVIVCLRQYSLLKLEEGTEEQRPVHRLCEKKILVSINIDSAATILQARMS